MRSASERDGKGGRVQASHATMRMAAMAKRADASWIGASSLSAIRIQGKAAAQEITVKATAA